MRPRPESPTNKTAGRLVHLEMLMRWAGEAEAEITALRAQLEHAELETANVRAELGVEITALRARVAELEQVSGDVCPTCGWAGIRGDDPCVFCRVAELEEASKPFAVRSHIIAFGPFGDETMARWNGKWAVVKRLRRLLGLEVDDA